MKIKLFDPKVFSHFNWQLFFVTIAILAIGLLNLFSATYELAVARYFPKQVIYSAVGIGLMLFVTVFHYRTLEKFSYIIYALNIVFLIMTMHVGKSALGAQRWIALGPIQIQPSEMAKIAVILGIAKFFQDRHGGRPMGVGALAVPSIMVLVPFILILKQPDLGTSLVVLFSCAVCLLFMGIQKRILLTIMIASIASAPLVWNFVLKPYQKDRVITFLNPEKYPLGKGYQVIQAKIAIGSGEIAGKGFLKGTQTKLEFLPKQHTDFVFSNFAEEFGFMGATLLILLYAGFSILGLSVAQNSRDMYGLVLAIGLTSMIGLQAVINLAMESGLLPVVGVTLPLLSYGGTSLLTTLLAVGLLLNISMRSFVF